MNGGRGGSGGGGRGESGGERSSEWRQAFLYTRCVCFGCTGKDSQQQQMTSLTGEDNGSSSTTAASTSQMVDTNSLHHRRQKEKTKLTTMRLPETSEEIPSTTMTTTATAAAAPSSHRRRLDESFRQPMDQVKKDLNVVNDSADQILTLDGRRSVMLAGRQRRCQRSPPLPPPSSLRRHEDDDEEDAEKGERGASSSSSAMTTTTTGERGGRSCLRQMNHLSLLSSTSKDMRVLLDLQYLTQAFRVLNSANQWSFNIFTLNKLTNGRSLFYMTLHIFNQYDFLRSFRLDVTRLMRCITLIESSYYFSNPYHNSVHAADVVQAMFCHLNEPKMANCLKPLEKMAAILSAACHDVDHPGTNQGFLIATANPLCSLYDNTSILENHHWRATIGILHESKLFEHFDRQTWQTMKRLIQTMILATDITRQTEILSVFRDHLSNDSLNLSTNEKNRSFILQITLKCADISNPCRPWHLSKCWSELICQEFFKQGDSERRLGLPVTPFCDRNQSTIATIQAGFMTHVAEPLFIEWDRFSATTNSRTLLDNLQHNRGQWQAITLSENNSGSVPAAKVAPPESNSIILEQQTTQVNGERVDDDATAVDPSLGDVDLDPSEAGRSSKRRHSLPVGIGSIASTGGRRLSLPSGAPIVLSVISRLTCLSETSHASEDACNSVKKSHASEDACNSVKKSKMRRCSFESCRPELQTMSKMRRCSFEDARLGQLMSYYTKQHQITRDSKYTENNRDSQKLFAGLENNHPAQQQLKGKDFFCSNVDNRCNGKRLEDGALPCYTSTVCRPPESEHSSSCCSRRQMARKMSLIAPKDHQMMTVIVGRKRSRSLVTSTLVCSFEGNRGTAAQLQSFETNLLLNGLVQSSDVDDAVSSSWGRWMSWWHKKTNNHFCTGSKAPPGPLNADAYHCHLPEEFDNGEKILPPPHPVPAAAASSSVGIVVGGRATMPPVQLLSCECPALATRLSVVDSHCRSSAKSGGSSIISRKPTSVFTSATEDAEAMPLLAADDSSSVWNNEM